MNRTSSPRHGRLRPSIVRTALLVALGGALGGCARGLATDWAQTQPAFRPQFVPVDKGQIEDGAPLPAAGIAENS